MENQENNNLSELDQLKAQYETLKQQFDQQEIVNDRLMKSSIKHGADFYRRYRWKQIILYPLFVILGLLIIKWHFDNNLSVRLFFVSFCLVSFAIELWILGILRLKTMENSDLLTLSNHARSFKELFTLFNFLSAIPMLILVLGFLLSQVGDGISLPNLRAYILTICLFFIVFVISMTVGIRHITRPCDEIIQKIEASDDMTDKKTRFDKGQRWFCIAMIVVFLGFDVWAYTIVGFDLKLPPMWRQVTYTRTDDSLPVEDNLSIWEVFADTLVPAEDVPALTKLWEEDPSLVVAKGVDDGQTVNLYALKMASPEGPLVSSKRIGGRPVVEKITVREPKVDHGEETIPMLFFMTPEAKQLWSEQFNPNEKTKSIDIAFVVDGVVYQKTTFTSIQGVTNNSFFINWRWGKDKLEDFCKQLIRQ